MLGEIADVKKTSWTQVIDFYDVGLVMLKSTTNLQEIFFGVGNNTVYGAASMKIPIQYTSKLLQMIYLGKTAM